MRLPGGSDGYRRSYFPTPSLNDRVREVYPSLSEEELQSVVLQLQTHPDGARVELSRLSSELSRLHQDLNTWINNSPTVHPQTRAPPERIWNNRPFDTIAGCWLRKSSAVGDDNQTGTSMHRMTPSAMYSVCRADHWRSADADGRLQPCVVARPRRQSCRAWCSRVFAALQWSSSTGVTPLYTGEASRRHRANDES